MKISNELLAAYAENNVSKEERNQVRQYLKENPSELESVMMMMDEDYEMEVEGRTACPTAKPIIFSDSHQELKIAAKCPSNVSNISFRKSVKEPKSLFGFISKDDKPTNQKINFDTTAKYSSKTFNKRLEDLLDEL